MIRILLADDHPIVREGLRAVLETQADFEVIAEATNGEEALRLALTLQPDIVLLDLEMPVLDGVETIRRLRQQQPVVASKLLRHMGQGAQHIGTRQGTVAARRTPPYEPLTERELEVLHLLAQGMPNKEIAAQLVISERTAKFHVSSIMGKLGATNR